MEQLQIPPVSHLRLELRQKPATGGLTAGQDTAYTAYTFRAANFTRHERMRCSIEAILR